MLVKESIIQGFKVEVRFNHGFYNSWYCGYIYLPANRYGEYSRDIEYDMPLHGGVTYIDIDGDDLIVGLDTGHYGDFNDNNEQIRDTEYVLQSLSDGIEWLLEKYK